LRVNQKHIIEENRKRLEEFWQEYDPITGVGSKVRRRKLVYWSRGAEVELWLPVAMFNEATIQLLEERGSIEDVVKEFNGGVCSPEFHDDFENGLITLRFKYDFEFWAFTCVTILDKESSQPIQFKLNRSQRRYLARLEKMRLARKPIRVILVKARQWGGSTLTQVYMAWIQIIHKENWSSAVLAEVDDQATNVRGMYERLMDNYPAVLGSLSWKPYQGSSKNKELVERGGIIGVGSVQHPDNLRSYSFQMIHCTEVGIWQSTPKRSAEALAQSFMAGILDKPYTLIVLESTARGVGNYFHRTYQKAVKNMEEGKPGFDPVFVGTWEIELYQLEIEDHEAFINTMTDYDWFMWELGATLEAINWYKVTKELKGYDDMQMMEEFPNTAEEAFQSTGRRVFNQLYVKAAEKDVLKPVATGELFGEEVDGPGSLKKVEFQSQPGGLLQVWEFPDHTRKVKNRYCAFADIGGRTAKADYSVVKVLDRYWMMDGGVPEVVAVWRGHLDQDLFAWKAAQLSRWYNNAHLAIETNSLRTDIDGDGDHFLTILDEIVDYYPHLYCRTDQEKIRQGAPVRYGFHTNLKTKELIINFLNKAFRKRMYKERSQNAINEARWYERKPNGKYGAIEGQHDDELIVTAGDVWLAYDMDIPVDVTGVSVVHSPRLMRESTL